MDKGRKKRFTDRRDGRRLRTLSPINALMPYLMKKKNDANNYFKDTVDIYEAEKFLRWKRTHGYPGMGFLHIFIASYIRVTAQYPAINRFVSGQRIFARNKIECIMMVKREMKALSEETSIKVAFEPTDSITEVYRKMNAEIEKVKKEGDATETDDAAIMLMKLPRLIRKFLVFILDILDYFDLVPKSLVSASPFHGSIVITDLGSIGLPALYHHLYNFGNVPLFISFGTKRKTYEPRKDGSFAERRYMDYTLVLDERICDGFYFSQVFRMFNSILRKPQMLDQPPEVILEDVE